MLSLKHAFTPGMSAPIPGGIGYIKGDAIHADQIHLGQIAEGNHTKPLTYLTQNVGSGRSFYMGVGGMLNFSYIAELQPTEAVLFDVNPLQTLFWTECITRMKVEPLTGFLSFLKNSPEIIRDRLKRDFHAVNLSIAGCQSNFRMNQKPESPHQWLGGFFRGLSPRPWLEGRGSAAHQWITESGYQTLQNLARTGSLRAITLDILDRDRCDAIGHAVALEKFERSTIYVNSLRLFLHGDRDWTGRRGVNATATNFDSNIALLAPTPEKIIVEDHVMIHHTPNAKPRKLEF